MKCIVIYQQNGEVVVVHPSYKGKSFEASKKAGENEDQYLLGVLERHVAKHPEHQNLNFDIIEPHELPSREFRSQWRGRKGQKVRVEQA
jgi:hypothetical protein